jgi:hypothetical protein
VKAPRVREIAAAYRRVEALLDRQGLLLLHDAKFPCATACIAGEPVRGSWWGHAKGKLIYETLTRIEDGVAWTKVVLGKESLVHRRLWPALVAAAASGQGWQTAGLEADARQLLRRVREGRPVPIAGVSAATGRKLAAVATDLERRLLARGYTEHTPSGRHVRFLETWSAWAKRNGIRKRDLPGADAALRALSAPVRAWIGGGEPAGLLPWSPP